MLPTTHNNQPTIQSLSQAVTNGGSSMILQQPKQHQSLPADIPFPSPNSSVRDIPWRTLEDIKPPPAPLLRTMNHPLQRRAESIEEPQSQIAKVTNVTTDILNS